MRHFWGALSASFMDAERFSRNFSFARSSHRGVRTPGHSVTASMSLTARLRRSICFQSVAGSVATVISIPSFERIFFSDLSPYLVATSHTCAKQSFGFSIRSSRQTRVHRVSKPEPDVVASMKRLSLDGMSLASAMDSSYGKRSSRAETFIFSNSACRAMRVGRSGAARYIASRRFRYTLTDARTASSTSGISGFERLRLSRSSFFSRSRSIPSFASFDDISGCALMSRSNSESSRDIVSKFSSAPDSALESIASSVPATATASRRLFSDAAKSFTHSNPGDPVGIPDWRSSEMRSVRRSWKR